MRNTRGTTNGTFHCLTVGVLLTSHMQIPVKQYRVQPIVAVVASGRILMKRDSLHISQQLTIQTAQILMVRYVLIHHRHLAATDTCTNVTHPIIIAYTLMLVVGIGLTGLGSIEHNLFLRLLIRANQSTATAGGYHLVAIERKHAVFAKSSEDLPVKLASKAFGGILYDRNTIFICH